MPGGLAASTALKSRSKNRRNFLNSVKIVPYIFVLPFILSFLLFFLYPIISTVIMSFQEIQGPYDVKFIGLDNYRNLFNEHFFNALAVTSRYTFWTILVLIPLPMLLAVLLNNKELKSRNFFRSAYFLPALTSVIIAGLFFRLAFGEQETTLVNYLLGKLSGIAPLAWLQGKHTAMFAMVVLCTWRWLGVNIIYFLSGMQSIPPELYESASIDGASAFQKLKSITIPGLKPVIIYVLTISIYGGYSMFAESFAIFSGPRSPGEIGMTLVNYIYQEGFNNNDLGFGSTVGIALLLIVMLINILQLSVMGFFKKESD